MEHHSIQKLLRFVHPSLRIDEQTTEKLNNMMYKIILHLVLSVPKDRLITSREIRGIVKTKFEDTRFKQINRWIEKKNKYIHPQKIYKILCQTLPKSRIHTRSSSIYITSFIEHFIFEILGKSGEYAKTLQVTTINVDMIHQMIKDNPRLVSFFYDLET